METDTTSKDPDTQDGERHSNRSWVLISIAFGLLYQLFTKGASWHWVVITGMVMLAGICSTAGILHAMRSALSHDRALQNDKTR